MRTFVWYKSGHDRRVSNFWPCPGQLKFRHWSSLGPSLPYHHRRLQSYICTNRKPLAGERPPPARLPAKTEKTVTTIWNVEWVANDSWQWKVLWNPIYWPPLFKRVNVCLEFKFVFLKLLKQHRLLSHITKQHIRGVELFAKAPQFGRTSKLLHNLHDEGSNTSIRPALPAYNCFYLRGSLSTSMASKKVSKSLLTSLDIACIAWFKHFYQKGSDRVLGSRKDVAHVDLLIIQLCCAVSRRQLSSPADCVERFSAANWVLTQKRFESVGYHDCVVRCTAADWVPQQIARYSIVLCGFPPPIEYSTQIGLGLYQ